MFAWTVGFDLSFGLRIRQHSLCKRTWPMPTFLKPSSCDLNSHMIQVLISIWVHLILGIDANVTLNLCLMPYSKPFNEYGIWYMKKIMKLLAWMWLSLFHALLFILLFVYWYCLILKSKGKMGFYMTFLSVGFHPIGQIFSTLNF